MHQLLLFAPVPASRHTLVLNILAGIAAMQPRSFHERHTIHRPLRPLGSVKSTQVGGSQAVGGAGAHALQGAMQGELFYLHLVEEGGVEEESEKDRDNEDVLMDEEKTENPPTSTPRQSSSSSVPKYTIQFRDTPDAGTRRPVTSRLMVDIPVSSGDAKAFMTALDYAPITTYHLHGHTLTHSSTLITLFQPLIPSSSSSPSTKVSPNPISSHRKELKPLDPSTYILQAEVKIMDGNKPELMSRGVKELMAMKEMLKGVVELEPGERLGLDMRVK